MKRKFLVETDQKGNQTKIQLTITSMVDVNGPNYGVSLATWLCFTMQSGLASACSISQIYNPLECKPYISNQAGGLVSVGAIPLEHLFLKNYLHSVFKLIDH